MSIALNHTIVHASDRDATATFLAEMLGLPEPQEYGPFRVVELANGVSLDVMADRGTFQPQHYAFLVGEDDFDAILARIEERSLAHWADPAHQQEGRINHHDGGRGLYWEGPDGHNLEIITVPYGGF
ncbi:bleomycin resistance protein [Nocardioides silvaticus]|uniref:Bleomycin resistance protein n=1 Tax=Nocardioides silvaticus TaxID=2201891 RepID=A0A316TA17_9ACTN|nr:VOC family protein [Nocardioides silvaticus]PWN01230.1 bleomycin resistance protein [Nocardioides silvaticus]